MRPRYSRFGKWPRYHDSPRQKCRSKKLTSFHGGPVIAGCSRRDAESAVVPAFWAPRIRKSGRGRAADVAFPYVQIAFRATTRTGAGIVGINSARSLTTRRRRYLRFLSRRRWADGGDRNSRRGGVIG